MSGTVVLSDARGGRARKGVTPVVAIVLLLMMTVAAAGGAYTWFNQMTEDVKGRATAQLQTSFAVKDLSCDAGSNNVSLALKNSGSRDIIASRVDVFMYDSRGSLNITMTQLDWSGYGFTDAGGFDTVTFNVDAANRTDFLERGEFYTLELEFTDAQSSVSGVSCVAG